MTLASDLEAAKAVIAEPKDWAKKPKSMHPACVFGAVTTTLGSVPHNPRWDNAVRALRRELPNGFDDLDYYNDAPATTHTDVLSLFDRAIAASKA